MASYSFGDIVDQERISNQRSQRTGPIKSVVWHHQASENDDGTIAMMVYETREVSANYTVNNDNPGNRGWARITGIVPEYLCAWTSSSRTVDGQALTIEVANSTGAPGWGIADTSFEACARIAVYAYQKYGVPLKRIVAGSDGAGHIGHKELPAVFGQGYATACPMNLDIDRILARAKQLLGLESLPGGALSQEEDDMYTDQDRSRDDLLFNVYGTEVRDRLYRLEIAAGENQPFRLYRDIDAQSPTYNWVYLVAPGICWHVPNWDYVGLIQNFRLAGPVIDVFGDGSGNVFGWLLSMYSNLVSTASNQDVLTALNALDVSGVPNLPAPVYASEILSAMSDLLDTAAAAKPTT